MITSIPVLEAGNSGAEVPEPGALTHPATVCVTVYVAESVTVIDGVVAVGHYRLVGAAHE